MFWKQIVNSIKDIIIFNNTGLHGSEIGLVTEWLKYHIANEAVEEQLDKLHVIRHKLR